MCSDRDLFVRFRRNREKLLLHSLTVAHLDGQLCGVPAASEGEEQGGSGLEQRLGLELELELEVGVELETPGLWIHALREW